MNPCPHCGANMDLVGRAHNCRPPVNGETKWVGRAPAERAKEARKALADAGGTTDQSRGTTKRPAEKGTPVQVRLQADLLAALDDFIAKAPGQMTRPEAVRRILSDRLE